MTKKMVNNLSVNLVPLFKFVSSLSSDNLSSSTKTAIVDVCKAELLLLCLG